jgi:hypothetical protein
MTSLPTATGGSTEAVVSQADREAAASGYFAWIGSNPVIPTKMCAGEAGDHSMVQAFARHHADATRELLEALAKLQACEAGYREVHDRFGGDARATGRAWDLMRRAGNEARDEIARATGAA